MYIYVFIYICMYATYLCQRAIEEDVSSDQHIPDSVMWHLPCTTAQYNASYHITSHHITSHHII